MKILRCFLLGFGVASLLACVSSGHAESTGNVDASQDGRIVAVGDVHGDFDQFVKLLQAVELLDRKLRWVGGTAHLVQLGDIPDRGPDSRKAMDLLMDLQEQAQQAGGQVTVLIGNHEAMMMIGDLRYVHPGEYAAFKDRNSRKRQRAYYQQTVDHIKASLPEEDWPEFDRAYRDAWEERFPLGYVEHRLAWAPTGKYGQWVLSRPAVAVIGDTLFVHGGLSPEYSSMSVTEINTRVRTALAMGEQVTENSILEDSSGPLWDRGWVNRLQNSANSAELDAVLSAYGVKRMVVAHTPLTSIIVPRFDGKVLMADVGLSAHYGHGLAALEIQGDNTNMLLADQRLAIPQAADEFDAYFESAKKLVAQPEKIDRYRALIEKARLEAEAQAAGEQQDQQVQQQVQQQ